jgi:large subunit ribosomal protein L17
MRHHSTKRKFSRKIGPRKALLKSLAVNLILKEKITTTQARAKEIRSLVERLVTKAKKQDLSAIRYVAKYLPKKPANKVIRDLGPRYQSRPGGYLRILKTQSRKGDGAQMAIVEFIK